MNRLGSSGRAGTKYLVALVGGLCVTGCMVKTPKEHLHSVVQSFNSAQRWGLVDRMAEHMPARAHALKRKDFGQLQVTNCEVGTLKVKKPGHAMALVKIEWYLLNQGTLRTTFVSQTWKQVDGNWKMVKQRRVAGAPYPFSQRDAWPDKG